MNYFQFLFELTILEVWFSLFGVNIFNPFPTFTFPSSSFSGGKSFNFSSSSSNVVSSDFSSSHSNVLSSDASLDHSLQSYASSVD